MGDQPGSSGAEGGPWPRSARRLKPRLQKAQSPPADWLEDQGAVGAPDLRRAAVSSSGSG